MLCTNVNNVEISLAPVAAVREILNSNQYPYRLSKKTSFLGEALLLLRPELAVASRAKSLT